MSNRIKFWLYLMVVGLLTASPIFAQNYKKLDSILKIATNQIYANPDQVIKVGNQVIKEAGNNVDYKIKGYKLISDAYSSKRDYEKSVEYLVKASELLDLSKDKLLKRNHPRRQRWHAGRAQPGAQHLAAGLARQQGAAAAV